MQKHVNRVDLVKSFPTHILLQNLASIQPRTSPVKFARSSGEPGSAASSRAAARPAASGELAALSTPGKTLEHSSAGK